MSDRNRCSHGSGSRRALSTARATSAAATCSPCRS
jgi:hypothetical protein